MSSYQNTLKSVLFLFLALLLVSPLNATASDVSEAFGTRGGESAADEEVDSDQAVESDGGGVFLWDVGCPTVFQVGFRHCPYYGRGGDRVCAVLLRQQPNLCPDWCPEVVDYDIYQCELFEVDDPATGMLEGCIGGRAEVTCGP